MTKKFTDDHEWVSHEGDLVVVGITHYAQEQLGEIVFVEMPEIDSNVGQGEEVAVIESVKAAGEVKAPVSGTVVAVNEKLNDAPETVNEDPEGEGWIYKISPADISELDALMDQDAYQALVDSLS